jgi:hypothetical protein
MWHHRGNKTNEGKTLRSKNHKHENENMIFSRKRKKEKAIIDTKNHKKMKMKIDKIEYSREFLQGGYQIFSDTML